MEERKEKILIFTTQLLDFLEVFHQFNKTIQLDSATMVEAPY